MPPTHPVKYKIAIYSGDIPSTSFIERLIMALAKEGFEVLLFGKLSKSAVYKGSSVNVLGNWAGIKGVVQAFIRIAVLRMKYPSRFSALKKYLGYSPLSGKLEFTNWQKYAPVLLNLPDIFHLQWAKAANEWIFLKELFGVKMILSLRGAHINISPLASPALAEAYTNSFLHYNAFHGVSKAIIDEARPYGVDEHRGHVIYSGLPSQPLRDKQHRDTSDTFRMLAVGRFHWKKGYHHLLDALALLKKQNIDFSLTLIAQGDMPEELLFQLHDLNLVKEVTLIKGLPYSQVIEQMQAHDVLVLPSVEEGIANVVLEAMMVGLPVISTDCGGMREVIEYGVNGFLVPVRNPEALAEAIVQVMELSPEAVENIRQQAHQTIVQRFTMEINIKAFVGMYESVMPCA
jgi:glycosyltransferase involved in cell wall biosynthesis